MQGQFNSRQFGGHQGLDRHTMGQMRMSPNEKYFQGQAMNQARKKANSGLGHINNQSLINNLNPLIGTEKSHKQIRNQRVRSQLDKHAPLPLDSVNHVGQSNSQIKGTLLSSDLDGRKDRNDSRKS